MNKNIIIFLLAAISLFLGCAQTPSPTVDLKEPTSITQESITSSDLVLDVRSADEFKSGHLSTALNIPHDQIDSHISELIKYKDKKVFVYCKSGRRAGIAIESLKKHGFSDLTNGGGFADLKTKGLN